MKSSITLFASLAATWWLLSGQPGVLLASLGLASVLTTVALVRRMDLIDGQSHPLHMSPALLRFWGQLLREIVVANVQVVRLILSPRTALRPEVVTVPMPQASVVGQVVLANAITLTPGTVTMDIDDGRLVVHALTAAGAADVRDGSMARRVPDDVGGDA